jgi:hypothetical protein
MSSGFELTSELSEVVYFPVENDTQSVVFIEYWLMTGIQINDTQTPVAQPKVMIYVVALVVRAPVAHGRIHLGQQVLAYWAPVKMIYTADATHNLFLTYL